MSSTITTLSLGQILEVVKGETKTFDVIARLNGVNQDMTGKIPFFSAKERSSDQNTVVAINGTDDPAEALVVLPQTGDDLGRLRFILTAAVTNALCAPLDHIFDVWTEDGPERLIILRPPYPGIPGSIMRVRESVTQFP